MNGAVNEATAFLIQAQEALLLLQQEKLPPKKFEEAKKQLIAVLPYLDHLKYVYPTDKFPSKLYRVRPQEALEADESEAEIDTFSYPSAEKCHISRANIEGCPVFYVADNQETALKEASCKQEQIVFVSEWNFINPRNTSFFLFFEKHLPKEHPWEKVRAQQATQFEEKLAHMPQPLQDQWRDLYKALCQVFMGEDYKVSSLIGHRLLYGKEQPHVQVLVYPSKAHNEKYCNLAIHPDFADEHLRLEKVFKMKITDENLLRKPELLKTGYAKDNKIIWNQASGEEQKPD
jgi:hypothetical protein